MNTKRVLLMIIIVSAGIIYKYSVKSMGSQGALSSSSSAANITDPIADKYFFANVINCFAGKNKLYSIQDFMGPVKLIEIPNPIDKTTYHLFGVHNDQQLNVDFPALKNRIAAVMKVSPKKTLQLIGDSNPFSTQGTIFARQFLASHLPGDHILEYGYTGYRDKSGTGAQLDANALLNEYADKNPSQAYRLLGNTLGHTQFALAEWGTYGSPLARNFVVVYNGAGMMEEPRYDANGVKIAGFTTFGDDVVMSDHFLQANDGDYVICLEGGAQSFLQVINELRLGMHVHLVYNLRDAKNRTMFSTALFLSKVNQAFEQGTPTKKDIETILEAYKKNLASMFNMAKPDYKTKKELFDKAIKAFTEEGIYLRIKTHCKFYDAEGLMLEETVRSMV